MEKELALSEHVIAEATQMLKHFGAGTAGTGFLTCTPKAFASMTTKV